jgi:hypothetical protein
MEIENKEHQTSVEVDKEGECVVEIPLSILKAAGIKVGGKVSVEVCLDGDKAPSETPGANSEYCILISSAKDSETDIKSVEDVVDTES